eukprot:scaffold8374_cov175-Amphora_coffeaeformis.AAC.114
MQRCCGELSNSIEETLKVYSCPFCLTVLEASLLSALGRYTLRHPTHMRRRAGHALSLQSSSKRNLQRAPFRVLEM